MKKIFERENKRAVVRTIFGGDAILTAINYKSAIMAMIVLTLGIYMEMKIDVDDFNETNKKTVTMGVVLLVINLIMIMMKIGVYFFMKERM